MAKTKKTVFILLAVAVLMAAIPVFALKGAEFGGADNAASDVVAEITGGDYKPWFTPVMETWIGGELPGEIESLLFCVQCGLGVGVLSFFMGRFVERSKSGSQKKP